LPKPKPPTKWEAFAKKKGLCIHAARDHQIILMLFM